jgi:hypothetical protein
MRWSLLVNGDSRTQPLDIINIGLLHLPQELAGIGGKRFYIPSLAFGIYGIEG